MKALFPVSIKQAEEQKNRKQGRGKDWKRTEARRECMFYFFLYPVQYVSICIPSGSATAARIFFYIDQNEKQKRERKRYRRGNGTAVFYPGTEETEPRRRLFILLYIYIPSFIFTHIYLFIFRK